MGPLVLAGVSWPVVRLGEVVRGGKGRGQLIGEWWEIFFFGSLVMRL